ncbi:putative malate dehydrogenase 1B [Amphibalanus amphitrite]|uniref:Putative malate dehydrogenase 1B n=1 Tax=Amphibalanus amphitrite TaxID=1232801 RepID=A0A6A4X2Z7_AMPAM|nr:putative malate dehydrogenase 1B [Amphibalanus amphitrite]
MAASQFVIAGRVDCERYARLEAAADYFQSRLPSFRVHKEPQTALEWPCYLRRTAAAADCWFGGLSEFLQFAAVYYGLTPPELSPLVARQMATHTAGQFELERKQRRQARVALERRLTVVSVLGSPLSEAAYHFLATLATGSVLGESVLLRLQLLGDPADPALAALRCELLDLASPQLGQVALLPSVREAVRSATVIIILDPIPNITTTPPDEDRLPGDLAPGRGSRGGSARRSGDSRKLSIIVEDPDSEEKEEEALEQLMASRGGSSSSSRRSGRYRSPNASSELAELFCRMREYACAIDATAAARCRVLVAGGRMPCLAATMVLLHLPRLPRSNVIAVCQPRTNQLRALIAERLGVAAH